MAASRFDAPCVSVTKGFCAGLVCRDFERHRVIHFRDVRASDLNLQQVLVRQIPVKHLIVTIVGVDQVLVGADALRLVRQVLLQADLLQLLKLCIRWHGFVLNHSLHVPPEFQGHAAFRQHCLRWGDGRRSHSCNDSISKRNGDERTDVWWRACADLSRTCYIIAHRPSGLCTMQLNLATIPSLFPLGANLPRLHCTPTAHLCIMLLLLGFILGLHDAIRRGACVPPLGFMHAYTDATVQFFS